MGKSPIVKKNNANLSFFASLWTADRHGFRVKFIGLYGTVGFITIRDFSL